MIPFHVLHLQELVAGLHCPCRVGREDPVASTGLCHEDPAALD